MRDPRWGALSCLGHPGKGLRGPDPLPARRGRQVSRGIRTPVPTGPLPPVSSVSRGHWSKPSRLLSWSCCVPHLRARAGFILFILFFCAGFILPRVTGVPTLGSSGLRAPLGRWAGHSWTARRESRGFSSSDGLLPRRVLSERIAFLANSHDGGVWPSRGRRSHGPTGDRVGTPSSPVPVLLSFLSHRAALRSFGSAGTAATLSGRAQASAPEKPLAGASLMTAHVASAGKRAPPPLHQCPWPEALRAPPLSAVTLTEPSPVQPPVKPFGQSLAGTGASAAPPPPSEVRARIAWHVASCLGRRGSCGDSWIQSSSITNRF